MKPTTMHERTELRTAVMESVCEPLLGELAQHHIFSYIVQRKMGLGISMTHDTCIVTYCFCCLCETCPQTSIYLPYQVDTTLEARALRPLRHRQHRPTGVARVCACESHVNPDLRLTSADGKRTPPENRRIQRSPHGGPQVASQHESRATAHVHTHA